jgi:hypothetical protein
MATQTPPLRLTRDQLAAFLQNHEQIRAFENLFSLVQEIAPDLTQAAAIQAGNAMAAAIQALADAMAARQEAAVAEGVLDAKANLVIGSALEARQEVGIAEGVLDAKINQVIALLSRIAQAADLASTDPSLRNAESRVFDLVDFNQSAPVPADLPGRIYWNRDDGTLDVDQYGANTLQLGQEIQYYAKNTSGSSIPIGTPVMFTGTVGASGKLTFGLAVANGSVLADYMMGVTSQTIANNDFGYVTSFGLVRGFNTSGTPYGETWADGDLLYFGATSAGTWTKTQPQAPNIDTPVAVVVNAAGGGAGSIFVRMHVAEALTRLQDVYINGGGPSAGEVLIYDATQQRWENNHLTAGPGITITNGDASVTISATLLPLRTQVETPAATGFNVTVTSVVTGVTYDVWLLLKPTGAFATGTITLPAVGTCVDQQVVTVSCTQQVNALTVAGNGATVAGAPGVLSADSTFKLRYNLASTTWHRAE